MSVEEFIVQMVNWSPVVLALLYVVYRQEARIDRLTDALMEVTDCEEENGNE